MVRDVPIDIDLEAEFTRTPDRSNLRTVFRDWELRDPLRRLEEALEAAELEAIPRPEDVDTIEVKTGLARAPERHHAPEGRVARRSRSLPPEIPEGELIPREPKWRFAAYAGGNIALAGETDDPASSIQAARRPRRDRPRRQGARRRPAQPRLRHRGRRLPARPGPPRLPARRARRGARDRRRRRRRARHLRRPDPRARQARSARRSHERGLHGPAGHRSSSRSCTSCARPRRPASSSTRSSSRPSRTRIKRRRRRSSSARSGSSRARSS